jgi:hypothetical protein
MRTLLVVGLVLLIAGVVSIVFDGIPVKAERDTLRIGPLEATIEHEKEALVPRGVAIGAIIGGSVLVILGATRRKPS